MICKGYAKANNKFLKSWELTNLDDVSYTYL